MCVGDKRVPSLIVLFFSCVTLLLAFVMIVLSIRFNNSGLSSSMGDFDDYTNSAFLFLLGSALIALLAGGFGVGLYCMKSNRICAVVFGCILLPAASMVFIGGFTIATISNTDVSTLR